MTVIALPDRSQRGGADDLLATLIEGLPAAAWLVNPTTRRVTAVNGEAIRLLGRPREQFVGMAAGDILLSPEDAWFWSQDPSQTEPGIDSMVVHVGHDGQPRHLQRRVRRLMAGALPTLIVTAIDRTDQRRVEDERETLLAELQATLESTADGIFVIDTMGHVQAYNQRFADMWSLPEDLLERRDSEPILDWMQALVVDPPDDARLQAALRMAAMSRSCDRITLRNGQVFERVSLPQLNRGHPIGRVYSYRDLTERVAADHKIRELSFTDTLTGLPNRGYLEHRLGPAIALAARESGNFALMLLDLDHFKQINDSLGRAAGDDVLREVGLRLKACLREGDLIARVGGDQFALLLHHADTAGSEQGARRLLDAVAEPFTVEMSQFTITCSIGGALFPRDGQSGDELMRCAETAMTQAKAAGRSDFRFHRRDSPVIDLRSRIRLDHAMRQALVSNRYRLHYQPQVELATGRVLGAEALIRWRDPERGEISPGEFIPIAEDTGFIIAIGDWVLRQAVHQASAWNARGWQMPISVNVSALQFHQDGFVDRVAATLHGCGLPGHLLELELTESILVRDANEALARLQRLSALGVGLAIDDFGTGYSSLAYLKRFPIRKLKIDRSFIRGLPDDDSDAGIVNAIVHMARALRMSVVAEGVETEPQRRFLADAGCDQFQGFLFAPALGVREFEHRLQPVRGAPAR